MDLCRRQKANNQHSFPTTAEPGKVDNDKSESDEAQKGRLDETMKM